MDNTPYIIALEQAATAVRKTGVDPGTGYSKWIADQILKYAEYIKKGHGAHIVRPGDWFNGYFYWLEINLRPGQTLITPCELQWSTGDYVNGKLEHDGLKTVWAGQSNYQSLDDYGVNWRLWDKRPSDGHRENVPWTKIT